MESHARTKNPTERSKKTVYPSRLDPDFSEHPIGDQQVVSSSSGEPPIERRPPRRRHPHK
jgi:hypothetical protein